ncbi:hypothetical protein IAU60_001747 [Kwoniella sp. DSM 27419]
MAPRKSKQKASSPPSSPAAWEGNNAISQQLSADIQVQDEILSQLYDELAVLDKEASDAAKGVLNGLFEMYERHHQEVKKHGEVIQGAYEGEKNAVDALKELVRSMSVSKGEKTN